MENYLPDVVLEDILDALVAEDGLLDGAVVALLKDIPTLNRALVWDDLTEADFSGYARSSALTWSTPYIDSETGRPVVSAPTHEFRSTTATPFVSNVIEGYALIIPGGTPTLRSIVRYTSPVPIAEANRVHAVRPEFGLVNVQGGNAVLAG